MFFYPCPSAGPAVRVRSVLVLSSLLPLLLQTTNAISTISPTTNATAEHSSRSASSNSGLPPIVVICIVASAVFFIALGSISLYLYVRRSRERTRRNEHREKAWQFKDMQRQGLRPAMTTEDISTGNTSIPISDSVLMTETTSTPRYPTKALHW